MESKQYSEFTCGQGTMAPTNGTAQREPKERVNRERTWSSVSHFLSRLAGPSGLYVLHLGPGGAPTDFTITTYLAVYRRTDVSAVSPSRGEC